MMTENKKKKINDIILIAFLLAVAVIIGFYLYTRDEMAGGKQLQILVDGQLVQTYEYTTDSCYNIEITLETGNIVCIEDGQVYMKEADCPDGLCVRQGAISKAGESIICLPHKVVVRIKDISDEHTTSETEGLDVMPR